MEQRANAVVLDGFERIKQIVHQTAEGLDAEELAFRPTASANSIAWLVWHLTRIQDDHMSELADAEQCWTSKWAAKFDLSLEPDDTGYGHSSEKVASVQASAPLLLGYYDAVHAASVAYIKTLQAEDYDRIVDTNWDPPVTLAVRLVSVIADDLQHAGQAAYVRGLLTAKRS